MKLGRSAARGAAVSLSAQVVRLVIQLGALVVLSRFLTPAEVGLVALAMVTIGWALILQDLGLSTASIQAKTLSNGQRSNLMWINVGLGTFLCLCTVLAAAPLANLFGHPELVVILRVLSAQFILAGITAQFSANIVRELKFTNLAIAEVVSQLVGVCCSISLAILGFGPWALVVQALVSQVTLTAIIVPLGWWPVRRYDRRQSIGPMLVFGANLAGSQLLNYVSRTADVFVVGVTLSATSVGFYNRALQLVAVPLQQMQAPATRVALPVLARIHDQKEQFSDFLLTGQTALLYAVVSLMGFLAAFSEPIVAVALGSQWSESAHLVRILAIGGIFQAAGYATYWIFLAKGLTKNNLQLDLICRPIAICFILVGSLWGLEGVAVGVAAGSFIGWIGSLLWLSRLTEAPLKRMFFVALRAILLFLGSAFAALWATLALGVSPTILVLAFGMGIYVSVALITIAMVPRIRSDITRALRALRALRTSSRG